MKLFQGEHTCFQYNWDMSGLVLIKTDTCTTEVSGEDLVNFVAEFVRSQKIAKLEEADTAELLGIEIP